MRAAIVAAAAAVAALQAPAYTEPNVAPSYVARPFQGRDSFALGRTTVLDNATVAVTRLRFAQGAREDIHTHPFSLLIVQLSPGETTVMDREMRRVGNGAGEVWFIPADTPHAVTNRSAGSVEMLAIAVKPDRPAAPAAPPIEAPEGITRATLVDNADVRVVRVRFAPGAREPIHSHPNDLLTVQITPGKVEILVGTARSALYREPGFVLFVARNVKHSYASADDAPFELLSVAVK